MSDYRYCKDKDSYFEDRLNHNDRLNCNDRLNHEEKENCFERPERCCQTTTCNPFKPNCKSNCCSGLPKVTPDLSSVFSVPILADKIFDCMKLEIPFPGLLENLEFTINSQPPQNGAYAAGTDVCVDRVSFSYDAIGAVVTNNILEGNITICSEQVDATAINPTTINGTTIANDFSITTGNIPCCHSCHNHHNNKNGTNCRVLERGLNFYISNLVITVTGRAGCIPFTAESAPQSGLLTTVLGLPSEFNFFGRICLPHLNSGIPLRENFRECLSIECIEPTNQLQETQGDFTFNATVESSILIIKSLYALIQENLSVLAIDTPREHCCNNSGLMKPHK